MISIKQHGNFKKTEKFLKKVGRGNVVLGLSELAQIGVEALSNATPKDTGRTASSWNYTIERENGIWKICWNNTNVNDGVNIALILQLGHATGTGGYVEGYDYINPTMRPVFDMIANKAWEEVTK